MQPHTLKNLTWVLIVVTALWVILLILSQINAPATPTLADKINSISPPDVVFYVNYINAALITIMTVMVFAGLYLRIKDEYPLWALIGLTFVPVYGLGNLVSYLSQVFVVPELLALYLIPDSSATAKVLLGLVLHDWTGSAVAALNSLSYAVLGIPSVIFGVLIGKEHPDLRFSGWVIFVSGVLSILALLGIATGSILLGLLSPISGFVFLAALILMVRKEAYC